MDQANRLENFFSPIYVSFEYVISNINLIHWEEEEQLFYYNTVCRWRQFFWGDAGRAWVLGDYISKTVWLSYLPCVSHQLIWNVFWASQMNQALRRLNLERHAKGPWKGVKTISGFLWNTGAVLLSMLFGSKTDGLKAVLISVPFGLEAGLWSQSCLLTDIWKKNKFQHGKAIGLRGPSGLAQNNAVSAEPLTVVATVRVRAQMHFVYFRPLGSSVGPPSPTHFEGGQNNFRFSVKYWSRSVIHAFWIQNRRSQSCPHIRAFRIRGRLVESVMPFDWHLKEE